MEIQTSLSLPPLFFFPTQYHTYIQSSVLIGTHSVAFGDSISVILASLISLQSSQKYLLFQATKAWPSLHLHSISPHIIYSFCYKMHMHYLEKPAPIDMYCDIVYN